jgi:hypothetical protein
MRVVALAVCVAWGCGPVNYISQVSFKASSAVEAARAAQAERYAPYEYTSAVEYLHKAKEEAGYADHQAAVRFGQKAEEMAEKAKKLALEASKGKGDNESPPQIEIKEATP